jgi:hypothetical protein
VSINVEADVRRIVREVSLASVVLYREPGKATSELQPHIGQFDLGGSEVIELADDIAAIVDLSNIEIPPNCLFHEVLFDFGRVVTINGVRLIGASDAMWHNNSIRCRFDFRTPPPPR